jgi:hypothetical protein
MIDLIKRIWRQIRGKWTSMRLLSQILYFATSPVYLLFTMRRSWPILGRFGCALWLWTALKTLVLASFDGWIQTRSGDVTYFSGDKDRELRTLGKLKGSWELLSASWGVDAIRLNTVTPEVLTRRDGFFTILVNLIVSILLVSYSIFNFRRCRHSCRCWLLQHDWIRGGVKYTTALFWG